MRTNNLSLFELNNLVRGVLELELSSMYWIVAETSDVRKNQNGHCYLELIQRDSSARSIIAKARAMIWSNTFSLLKPYFEETTQQRFSSGLKILIQVSISFHELYGYSLTIHDIDPSYTLGDQAKKRAEIVKQLDEDGVLLLNKELPIPQPLQRLAIISSPTAAGYEDFCHQLHSNVFHFVFYDKLFPATMQGEQTENSVLNALDKIYQFKDLFDAVVIIRGGGATSELSSFDSYLLASSCAQFPLPIFVGIGHDRDQTVLDIVANTSAKTPTAVAEFIINENLSQWNLINTTASRIKEISEKRFNHDFLTLKKIQMATSLMLKQKMQEQLINLQWYKKTIEKTCFFTLSREEDQVANAVESLANHAQSAFKQANLLLDSMQKNIELQSPENLLKKGYTYILKDQKLIKNKRDLKIGDEIETVFHDGTINSVIK